jgi:hypothetical protein
MAEHTAGVSMEDIELLCPKAKKVADATAGEEREHTAFNEGPIDDCDEKNLGSHPSADITNIFAGEPGKNTQLDGGFINVESFFDGDEMARFEVRDRDLRENWVFSEEWTKTVCALLNTDAEMVGADVEVTKVDSDFYLGNVKDTSSTDLITRRLSRGVVAECLTMTPRDTLAIVGNPGIGKSWTLIYALQQLLLRNGACVLFFIAKRGRALACIRRYNAVYVWEAGMAEAKSDLYSCENVWVLLDPKEATRGSTDTYHVDYFMLPQTTKGILLMTFPRRIL